MNTLKTKNLSVEPMDTITLTDSDKKLFEYCASNQWDISKILDSTEYESDPITFDLV